MMLASTSLPTKSGNHVNHHHQPHHHNHHNSSHHVNYDFIEVKSKFDAEFRRFSLDKSSIKDFSSFHSSLESFHKLFGVPFSIFYTDPTHGDLLPINNDENFAKALSSAKPFIRVFLQRKGESWDHLNSFRKKNQPSSFFSSFLPISSVTGSSPSKNRLSIGLPEDFRQVSQIIDVDILPETCRRVRLVKHGSDKPLGFYIRDGTSVRVTPQGLEKVPGIFISRLVPGGLAEGTGLLAVNDEVLEVNGIEVNGKSLDQVTDMMVANSSNLIITIRPATQRSLPLPASSSGSYTNSAFRMAGGGSRDGSRGSGSRGSRNTSNSDDEDEDEIKDHLNPTSQSSSTSTAAATNNNGRNGDIKEEVEDDDDDDDDTEQMITSSSSPCLLPENNGNQHHHHNHHLMHHNHNHNQQQHPNHNSHMTTHHNESPSAIRIGPKSTTINLGMNKDNHNKIRIESSNPFITPHDDEEDQDDEDIEEDIVRL